MKGAGLSMSSPTPILCIDKGYMNLVTVIPGGCWRGGGGGGGGDTCNLIVLNEIVFYPNYRCLFCHICCFCVHRMIPSGN